MHLNWLALLPQTISLATGRGRLACVLAALSLLLIAACGDAVTPAPAASPGLSPPAAGPSQESWRVKWDQTLAAARDEGQVMVYAAASPDVRAAIGRAFKQRFGIQIDFLIGTGAELTLRLLAERRAGLYLGDVILAGGGTLITYMRPEGLLAPLQPFLLLPEVTGPGMWSGGALPYLDREAKVLGLTAQYNTGLIRNTEAVKDGAVSSFSDLLKPEWKGKLVMFDPSVAGGGSNLVAALALGGWGMERAREYLVGLVQQEVALTRDSRLQVEWVARGKYPLGLGAVSAHTTSFIRAGAPVLPMKLVEGGYVTSGSGGLGLLVKPAHPAAATVFVNWLLSREGQTVFSGAAGNPSKRTDVPLADSSPSFVPDAGEKPYVEDEEGILARGKLMTMAGEVLAPLFK